VLAGWGQIFVEPRHEKHDLPPGDATDDTASSQHQHHRPPLAPHSSVSSSHRQLPLLLEPDSNLEITETLASAPAHQLQMPAFVGWRHQTGLAPAQSPCWWCGESWWWSKLVPQNGSTECHTPSPLLRRARPTVNMAPAVAKCQNLMSQKVRFCVRRQK
jgi:hypothetical protein